MQRVRLGSYFDSAWGFSKSLPICTKLFCLISFLITLLDWLVCFKYTNVSSKSVFALLPSSFIYTPWALITYGLREKSPLVLIGTLLCVSACGKMFEPHWGRNEMAKFLSLVNVLTGLGYCLFFILVFGLTGSSRYLNSQAAMGLGPTVTAFSVCCKQAYPEYNVKIFRTFGFKLKQFPSILLASISILGLVFSYFRSDTVLFWFSAFVSWVYLRFFKFQDSIRGDRSETFSFVSFFPTILRPPIKIISNMVFSILVKLHICLPIHSISAYDLESGNYYVRVSPSERQTSSFSVADDAERRKALALKALDMRLKLAPSVDVAGSSSRPGESTNPDASDHIPNALN